ncbi:serine protease [Bacillus cereus]|nr:serine protease [Bacillus cereus]
MNVRQVLSSMLVLMFFLFSCMNSNVQAQVTGTRYKVDTFSPIVVRITSLDDESRWGTGIVVGPNKVLTAAHVLKQNNLIIYQEEHKDNPRKAVTIASAKRHPDYKPYGATKHFHDLAVITTNETFKTYGSFGHAEYSFLFSDLTWIGYPGDLIQQEEEFSQWRTDHIALVDNGDLSKFVLNESVVSYGGQSGSGIIDNSNPEGQLIIGILTGGIGPEDTDITLLRGSNYNFVYHEVVPFASVSKLSTLENKKE